MKSALLIRIKQAAFAALLMSSLLGAGNAFAVCTPAAPSLANLDSYPCYKVGADPDPAEWMFKTDTVIDVKLILTQEQYDQLNNPDNFNTDPVTGRPIEGDYADVKIYRIEVLDSTGTLKYALNYNYITDKGAKVKLKGSTSFLPLTHAISGLPLKASFKIKGLSSGAAFGVKKLTLNNMRQDRSKIHEALAYAVFRAMDVPASRSGYARVYLSVINNPALQNVYYGLHSNVESLDTVFTGFRFPDMQHLYESNGGTDVTAELVSKYEMKESATGLETDRSDLSALLAVAEVQGQGWRAAFETKADLREMVIEWAVENYIGHWDGYHNGNNHYLHSRSNGVFSMIPSGVDQTFGYPFGFESANGYLFKRCMQDVSCHIMYGDALQQVRTTIASVRLNEKAQNIYTYIRPYIEADPLKTVQQRWFDVPLTMDEADGAAADAITFINERSADLDAWLLCCNPQDTDSDGVYDKDDPFPFDPAETADTDNDFIGNNIDTNDDADEVLDALDNCPLIPNNNQNNTDGDTEGDACDLTPNGDIDSDGIDLFVDNCPTLSNADQLDKDGDAQGDVCDTDDDADEVPDVSDNCPLIPNNDQSNTDGDTEGDACDITLNGDTDSDGIDQLVDNCPAIFNTNQRDIDGDTQGDACDSDDDNDSALDVSDNCPFIPNSDQTNTDGDAQGNACDTNDDHDSALDLYDNYPLISLGGLTDTDGDGIPDICDAVCLATGMTADIDADNDTLTDIEEAVLGSNALNSFDPPHVSVVSSVLLGGQLYAGVDDVNFSTSKATHMVLWSAGDGSFDSEDFTFDKKASDLVVGDDSLFSLSGRLVMGLFGFEAVNNVTKLSGHRMPGASDYNCAVVSGAVQCWNGQDMASLHSITTGLTAVVDLAVGVHTSCAVDGSSVYCWDNATEATVDFDAATTGPSAVVLGDAHRCAINSDRTVTCGGDNTFGQSGDASPADGKVDGVSNALKISAGANHTCVLMGNYVAPASLEVKCWGDNHLYQTTVPANLAAGGIATPVAIRSEGDRTCAVITGSNLAQNAIKCWPIGIDTTLSTTPVMPDSDSDGMPDAWEITYSFNPQVDDASGDFDGDAINNKQEYINGSNPTTVVTIKNDYNNDDVAGWIWKGQGTGVTTLSENWQLTFPLYSANWGIPERFYFPVFPDQENWEIITSGDFNKDGDADILWRNKTTAAWKIWQVQDGLRSAQNDLADFDLNHEWIVVGAGDSDKDGDDDIIFNKTSTGEVLIWEMQNHVLAASHNVGTKTGYTLSRIGDFNKDGDVDLLFRQNGADALITWEVENSAFVAERALASTGAGFNPVCAGDFDNDGDDDIMFWHISTNQEKWFVMENYVRIQRYGSGNEGFSLLGCSDYDGDGDADMLSRRLSDDKNRVVLQQNFGASKKTVYTNAYGGANGFVYRGNSN